MNTIKIFIVSIATLFLSSCVKSLEYEGVSIDNVTHFLYGGYNYQVHPNLGLMSWDAANSACNNLVAEGHDDWFLPSMGEMKAARDIGLIWVHGWTSTIESPAENGFFAFYYCFDEEDDDFIDWGEEYLLSVFPMRKQ